MRHLMNLIRGVVVLRLTGPFPERLIKAVLAPDSFI